jgi:hypothetical protein
MATRDLRWLDVHFLGRSCHCLPMKVLKVNGIQVVLVDHYDSIDITVYAMLATTCAVAWAARRCLRTDLQPTDLRPLQRPGPSVARLNAAEPYANTLKPGQLDVCAREV